MSKEADDPTKSTAAWDTQYAKLLEFYQQYKHCNVVRRGPNISLAKWIGKQRANKAKLSPLQLEKLNAVEFVWQSKKELDDAAWDNRFQRLAAYREKVGHADVPQKYGDDLELGTWVANQRRRFNQNTLRADRKERLDTLSFNWLVKGGNTGSTPGTSNPTKPSAYDAQWETMFQRLQAYKETHGHCNVPQNAEEDLGMWVSTQRRYFNKKTWIPGRGMREDRKVRLDSIGFEWNRAHAKRGPRPETKRRTEEIVERVVGGANKRAKLAMEQEEVAVGEETDARAEVAEEEGVQHVDAAIVRVDETDVAAVVQQEVENVVAAVQQEAVDAEAVAAVAAAYVEGPIEQV